MAIEANGSQPIFCRHSGIISAPIPTSAWTSHADRSSTRTGQDAAETPHRARIQSKGSRPEHYFDAILLLFAEHLVSLWSILQRHVVRDYEPWVDLAPLDFVEQHRHVSMHMGLSGLDGDR